MWVESNQSVKTKTEQPGTYSHRPIINRLKKNNCFVKQTAFHGIATQISSLPAAQSQIVPINTTSHSYTFISRSDWTQ